MRMIDADALVKKALTEACFDSRTEDVFLDLVDAQPTIEAEPVRHGRWIERFNGRYKQRRTYCSVCEQHSGIGGNKQEPPYCPHCGAKMDGGAER